MKGAVRKLLPLPSNRPSWRLCGAQDEDDHKTAINTRVTNSLSASLDNVSVAPSGPMPKDSSAAATCSLLRL